MASFHRIDFMILWQNLKAFQRIREGDQEEGKQPEQS